MLPLLLLFFSFAFLIGWPIPSWFRLWYACCLYEWAIFFLTFKCINFVQGTLKPSNTVCKNSGVVHQIAKCLLCELKFLTRLVLNLLRRSVCWIPEIPIFATIRCFFQKIVSHRTRVRISIDIILSNQIPSAVELFHLTYFFAIWSEKRKKLMRYTPGLDNSLVYVFNTVEYSILCLRMI